MNEVDYFKKIISEKIKHGSEDSVTEFKVNNTEPEMIGEYISALSNSATLIDKDYAYVIWGIDDESKNVQGTNFYPHKTKKGNEELLNWLHRMIKPSLSFSFHNVEYEEKKLSSINYTQGYSPPHIF
ncbi:ATP-binding protein [Staphylococcus warneri]|uniref:AlbA family DNA-binding domain-containing protein n=1 Tax=Staphylococcus warneri TaxID=1292 RepID=UPI00326171BD